MSELPSFLAGIASGWGTGMAMFVQMLGNEATYRCHFAFHVEAGEAKILIEPFLSHNPSTDNGWSGCSTGKNSTQGGDR